MAEKPPLPPKPKPPLPSKPRPKAAARPTTTTTTPAPGSRPAAAPPFKKPTLAPPPQVLPLKPPPAHQYRQQQYPPGGARKHPRPYRQQPPPHRRGGGGGCSCRRACCLATGLALLALCLALAAACLAYLYYRPRAPSFHLQPLSPVRLRLGGGGNSSSVSAMDATVGARVVSWNPNERVAFRYGDGEGRVSLRDADGDVALGWAPVHGFAHAPRTVATVAFVATARGVVLDEGVAARVRDRYRRRQQGFRVVVDAHVGVRVGAISTGMVPIRLLCDDGVMAPRAAAAGSSSSDGGTVVGPMSKCQVLLFRVRWFSLN
ncbi:NDR1/HIN1-like protein 13 [Miscanthus floridulus]|uniref:NDR1/HIN1-like protein 13 n=1 Tax=Miscanthus floridulus TaxID=154761 RepID=UPI0034589BDA